MPIRFDRLRLRAGRWLRLGRRVLAVGLLVTAALLATAEPVPSARDAEPTVTVLTASRDLPPGHVLAAADLAPAAWPHRLLSPSALDQDDNPIGRVLAAAVQRGEPITDLRLLGPGLVDSLGPTHRAVPVRLTDAGVSVLLRPGDRIDLYAVDNGIAAAAEIVTGELVAGNALVVGIPRAADQVVPEGAIVVVAVPLPAVAALVAAAYSRSLAATLAPP